MKKLLTWLGIGLAVLGFTACSKHNPMAPQVNPGHATVRAQGGVAVKSLEYYGNLSTGYAFKNPIAIAVNQTSGDVFISDMGNNRIQRRYYSGRPSLVTANPLVCDDAAIVNRSLRDNHSVALDSVNGNLYVADSGNDRILVFNPDNFHVISQIKSNNFIYGENPNAFKHPKGILPMSFSSGFGVQRRLYLCDGVHQNIRLFSFSPFKTITQAWNQYFYNHTISAYQNLQFMARDATSKFWVSDYTAGRVIQISPAYMETALQAVTAQHPTGLAVDKNNLLFVAEYQNRKLRIFNSDGSEQSFSYSSVIPFNALSGPAGLAIDNTHNILYVCDTDSNQVQQFVIHYQ